MGAMLVRRRDLSKRFVGLATASRDREKKEAAEALGPRRLDASRLAAYCCTPSGQAANWPPMKTIG